MILRRLVIYVVIAVASGTFGFLIGGGQIPEDLSSTPQSLAAQARATAAVLQDQEATLTEMLNCVRNRVSEGVSQVGWFQDDDQ
ncbi:MAG: hypothetical protein VX453_08010 [Acidobacteriota bacterium]|nr:hypothetical protein [Acidobacteriota bacterium]